MPGGPTDRFRVALFQHSGSGSVARISQELKFILAVSRNNLNLHAYSLVISYRRCWYRPCNAVLILERAAGRL